MNKNGIRLVAGGGCRAGVMSGMDEGQSASAAGL